MKIFSCKVEVFKHAVKKNGRNFNRTTGRPFKSEDLRLAEKILASKFYMLKNTAKPLPDDHFINAEFLFYFPESHFFTKKGKVNQKLPDLSNLYELPQDCLQAAGIIQNDTLINSHDGSARLPHDSDKYILEVTLSAVPMPKLANG